MKKGTVLAWIISFTMCFFVVAPVAFAQTPAPDSMCASIASSNYKACCEIKKTNATACAAYSAAQNKNTANTGTKSGAKDTATPVANPGGSFIPGVGSGSASPTDLSLGVHIDNPLHVSTIQEAIALFVRTIIKVALPVIVVFFLWSGLSFILAMGDPKKVTDAKNMFFYTVIGTLLILGAWTITNVIVGTVNSIGN